MSEDLRLNVLDLRASVPAASYRDDGFGNEAGHAAAAKAIAQFLEAAVCR